MPLLWKISTYLRWSYLKHIGCISTPKLRKYSLPLTWAKPIFCLVLNEFLLWIICLAYKSQPIHGNSNSCRLRLRLSVCYFVLTSIEVTKNVYVPNILLRCYVPHYYVHIFLKFTIFFVCFEVRVLRLYRANEKFHIAPTAILFWT